MDVSLFYSCGFSWIFFFLSQVWVLMELCAHGSLKEVLRRLGPLAEEAVGAVCHAMLCGLRYLHEEKQTMHRDVKVRPALSLLDRRTQRGRKAFLGR